MDLSKRSKNFTTYKWFVADLSRETVRQMVRHVPLLLLHLECSVFALWLLMLQADGQQRVEGAVGTSVVATSVPLCNAAVCPPQEEQGVGLLRFKGGLHLTSTNRDFGGLSAIRVAAYPVPASTISTAESRNVPSELQFVAVSDSATLVTGKLETNRNGWLIAMSNVTTGQLLNIDGKPLVGMDAETMLDLQDAESLAATSDTDPLAGDLLVSFERLHRVYRYSMAALGVAAVPVEQAGLGAHNGRISQCEENGFQHTATCCITLQHTPTHSNTHCAYCNTLQHTATHSSTLQHTPTHSNTLQHAATQCNTLQHTATYRNTLQHTARYCNILQHTATHCTTLQHTATYCDTQQHTSTQMWLDQEVR